MNVPVTSRPGPTMDYGSRYDHGGFDPRFEPFDPHSRDYRPQPMPPHYGDGYPTYGHEHKKKVGLLTKLGAKLGLSKASDHMGEYGNTFNEFGGQGIDYAHENYDDRLGRNPRSRNVNDVMDRRARELSPQGRELSPSGMDRRGRDFSPSRGRDFSPSRGRDFSPSRGRDFSPSRGRDMYRDAYPYGERDGSPPRGRGISPPRDRNFDRDFAPPRDQRGISPDRGRRMNPPSLPDDRMYGNRDLSPSGRNGRPYSDDMRPPRDLDDMSLFGNIRLKDVPDDVRENYEQKMRGDFKPAPQNFPDQRPNSFNNPKREDPPSKPFNAPPAPPPPEAYRSSERPPSYKAAARDPPVTYPDVDVPYDYRHGPNLANYRSY